MFVSVDGPALPPHPAVAALTTAVDALLELRAALPTLDDSTVLAVLRGLEIELCRLPAMEHALLTDVDNRGLGRDLGCKNTNGLLVSLLRLSPREAAAKIHAAAELGRGRALTGTELPARYPHVAAAQECGSLWPSQARVITTTIDGLPESVRREHGDDVERDLINHARQLDAHALGVVATRLSAYLDPDGAHVTSADHTRQRDLSISPHPDGSASLRGRLTPLAYETLLTVLDSTARPAPARPDGAPDCPGDDSGRPATSPTSQRRATRA